MKTIRALTLSILAILILGACKQINTEREPHWFKLNYSQFHEKEYEEYFLQRIDSMPEIKYKESIVDFYRKNNTPIWTVNGFQEHKIDSLMSYFDKSWQHGLSRNYFQYDSIQSVISKLKEREINENDLYPTLYNLEMSLTDNYLKYAHALEYGATDPKLVNGGKWLYETQQTDSDFVNKALKECYHIPKSLRKLQPMKEEYTLLQDELIRLHQIKDTNFKSIDPTILHQNQSSDNIIRLCARLKLTGELSQDYPTTSTLTPDVLNAVNLFRTSNNIPTSDSLDLETIEKLNRPISYYKRKLAANMERLRWKTIPEKGHTYISVNLPDFTLQTIVEDTMAFKTRICCGKTQNPKSDPKRKKNGLVQAFIAETPLLYSEIRSIVLNPEWSIPYDIIKNEYLAGLRINNTARIQREKLYVIDARNGKRVIPDSIDWNNVRENNIPYRLKQTSGRHNALGRIKFDFANNESVYLHDTNNKGAFKSRKRTFSHGCVRVENPFELAHILYQLNGFDSLKIEQLGIIVGDEPTTEEGQKYLEDKQRRDSIRYARLSEKERPYYRKLTPTGITLKNRMPLFIEYYTCFINDDKQIQYREDMYYKDENILKITEFK